jgi:ketosteroid isomerase-like protein
MLVMLAMWTGAGAAMAQQSDSEKTVWKLEQAFCQDTKAGNFSSAMKMIDPDFLGWGATGAVPMRKGDLAKALNDQAAKGTRFRSCEIEPVGSRAAGDVVLVEYYVSTVLVDKSGHTAHSRNRVTHTWVKRDRGWQMLGGMGARVTQMP